MGFGKDGLGVIINEARTQALGTLATDTGIFVGTKLATLERFRMLKSQVIAHMTIVAAGEGGGLTLWLVDGDFSLSEAEAAIEALGPLGPNDRIVEDNASRLVLLAGVVDDVSEVAGADAVSFHDMNTNAPVCVMKPRWTFARTKSWNWMVYNRAGALTTGSSVRILVRNFGVWVT